MEAYVLSLSAAFLYNVSPIAFFLSGTFTSWFLHLLTSTSNCMIFISYYLFLHLFVCFIYWETVLTIIQTTEFFISSILLKIFRRALS